MTTGHCDGGVSLSMTECVPDRSCRGSASLELGLSSPIVQVVPTAFPSDSKEQLENLAVPLPQLAEQRRIVADVNDVMALFARIAAGLAAAVAFSISFRSTRWNRRNPIARPPGESGRGAGRKRMGGAGPP